MRIGLQIVFSLAIVLSALWFYRARDFASAVTTVMAVGALLGSFLGQRRSKDRGYTRCEFSKLSETFLRAVQKRTRTKAEAFEPLCLLVVKNEQGELLVYLNENQRGKGFMLPNTPLNAVRSLRGQMLDLNTRSADLLGVEQSQLELRALADGTFFLSSKIDPSNGKITLYCYAFVFVHLPVATADQILSSSREFPRSWKSFNELVGDRATREGNSDVIGIIEHELASLERQTSSFRSDG